MPFLIELNVDGLFLEYDDQRSGDFEPLKSFKRDDKIVVLGLITSKLPELENPDSIKERIKEASQYIPFRKLSIKSSMWILKYGRRKRINGRGSME